MSKKHVDEYFNKIASQYKDMLNEIHDFEIECSRGLIDPERVELVKKSVEPLMNNYMRWSYMMYLLNLPNRQHKKNKFERLNKKYVTNIKDESTLKENSDVIDKLKSQNNYLKSI